MSIKGTAPMKLENQQTDEIFENYKNPEADAVIPKQDEQIDTTAEEMALNEDKNKATTIARQLAEADDEDEENPENPEIKAEKDKYQEFLQENQTRLDEHMENLIREFRNGRSDMTKLRTQFEATLDYCIKNGKSSSENIIFYVFTGAIDGLIEDGHLMYYDRYLINLPPLQFLLNSKQHNNPTELKKIAKKYFGSSYYRGKSGKDFKKFYWTILLNDTEVQNRIDKSVAEKKWDTDQAGEFVSAGNTNTSKVYMNNPNEDFNSAAIPNIYAGIRQQARYNAKGIKSKNGRKNIARQMAFFLMSESNSPKFTDDLLDDRPRNDQSATMGEIRTQMWRAFNTLNPKLATMLRSLGENPENNIIPLSDYLKKNYKITIGSTKELYENLDAVTRAVVDKAGFLKRRRYIKECLK